MTEFIDLDAVLGDQPMPARYNASLNGAGDGLAWKSPDTALLGSGRRPAPEFPLDLLGPFWADWIVKRAAGASAPVDYTATTLLACAGAALANVRWPVAGATWSEPPLLWCGLVGSPSSGKSPGMDAALSILHHVEEQMCDGYDEERLKCETRRQVARAVKEAWQEEVKANVRAGELAREMPTEAIEVETPPRPRIRVSDATIEALAKLAAALPRGLLLVRDELSGWLGSFDRYGGGGSDRAFALECYGGRQFIVDRVKNAEPIRIPHLSIGLVGGVQPDKLSGILDGPDDGLVARLLWCWPDNLPDFTLSRELASDGDACRAFSRLATLAMGTDDHGASQPKKIPLTREAEHALEQFAREVGRRANEASGVFAGALGKARGHLLRLSAIIEHLWWCASPIGPEPQAITLQAVHTAAGLLDGYFIPMAERVFGDATIPTKERQAIFLARQIRQRGLTSSDARDLRRAIGGSLRDADAMDAACTLLTDGGLIRPQFTRAGDNKGRTARNFETNPIVFGVRQ